MKAILVKYHRAGNVRGSRFVAHAEGVPKRSLPYDYALTADGNAEVAARTLALEHGWISDGSTLVGGELPNGDRCFVFVA